MRGRAALTPSLFIEKESAVRTLRLYDLLGETPTSIQDTDISGITDNSRQVAAGTLFFCVKGKNFDGADFAVEALARGAVAVVTDHDLHLDRQQLIVEDVRRFYGEMCASWFGHPERRLKIIGVTGTNGKTTITTLIKQILTKCGHKVGLIGTIQNEIDDEILHTENTTPLTFEYMQLLSRMSKAGCDCAVMEVSSFALAQNRIGPTHFRVGVFTNLTQEHLDYHGSMENYYAAKKQLFSACDVAVVNRDDAYGKRLLGEVRADRYSYSVKEEASFWAEDIVLKSDGCSFSFCVGRERFPVAINMPGEFNVSNAVAAIAACIKIGVSIEKIVSVIEQCVGVKGRCEVIPTGRDFTVICDYAHTPDALENVLSSVKAYAGEGRLMCLFGCGGDRDKTKRPLMAKAAARFCDRLIITSDNPRGEVPDDIIDDILAGLIGEKVPFERIADRRAAIFHAIETAKAGDIIVLCGKGHEDYQVINGDERIHFDEREVVKEGLLQLAMNTNATA